MRAHDMKATTMSPRQDDAPGLGFFSGVIFLGAGLIGMSLHRVAVGPQDARIALWAAFAILTILTGGLSLRLPIRACVVSFSDALIFLSVLLFGPELAALTAALDGYASSARNGGTFQKQLFNTAGMALSVGISARLFEWVQQAAVGRAPAERVIMATIALAASQFVLNTALVVTIVALKERISPIAVLRNSFVWSGVSMLAGSLTAAMVYLAIENLGAANCLAILPVPVILHLLYRAFLKHAHATNASSRN